MPRADLIGICSATGTVITLNNLTALLKENYKRDQEENTSHYSRPQYTNKTFHMLYGSSEGKIKVLPGRLICGALNHYNKFNP